MGSDLPGLLDDFLLVQTHHRAQDRKRGRGGDDRDVLKGLGRDLAQGIAGDDRPGGALVGNDLSGSQHESLQDDLPIACRDLGLEIPGDLVEVHRMEVRARSIGPAI